MADHCIHSLRLPHHHHFASPIMGISLTEWRSHIGSFTQRASRYRAAFSMARGRATRSVLQLVLFTAVLCSMLLLLASDVEVNPGPRQTAAGKYSESIIVFVERSIISPINYRLEQYKSHTLQLLFIIKCILNV